MGYLPSEVVNRISSINSSSLTYEKNAPKSPWEVLSQSAVKEFPRAAAMGGISGVTFFWDVLSWNRGSFRAIGYKN